MHPLLATRGRVTLYLLAWLPFGALLAYLLVMTGGLDWLPAAAISLPLALFYALLCLGPWYMCRVLPLAPSQVPKLLGNHLAAAIVAALIWIVLAKGLALAMGRSYFPRFDSRFSAQLPLLFGLGVLLYLLSVALHYLLLSVETSREAETRAQEARTLARESELKALKAQINPHFLFNCLNSIAALATVDGARAREMCIKLSEFLRNTLKLGEQPSISLGEELALARAYLDVEKVRFGKRLQIEFDADPLCDGCRVPSLLLQPLIENAVKHGIVGLIEGGTICLQARCGNGRLHVMIQNDFDPEAPAAAKHGLGLQNVRDRLRSLHENRARIDTAVSDRHFRVDLELPCGAHV
ncbi:MAG TPA: histidine kinase [Bryobacteraceae bacterium]|nr:histidine kinase [Bryobacteraceae bacterium]